MATTTHHTEQHPTAELTLSGWCARSLTSGRVVAAWQRAASQIDDERSWELLAAFVRPQLEQHTAELYPSPQLAHLLDAAPLDRGPLRAMLDERATLRPWVAGLLLRRPDLSEHDELELLAGDTELEGWQSGLYQTMRDRVLLQAMARDGGCASLELYSLVALDRLRCPEVRSQAAAALLSRRALSDPTRFAEVVHELPELLELTVEHLSREVERGRLLVSGLSGLLLRTEHPEALQAIARLFVEQLPAPAEVKLEVGALVQVRELLGPSALLAGAYRGDEQPVRAWLAGCELPDHELVAALVRSGSPLGLEGLLRHDPERARLLPVRPLPRLNIHEGQPWDLVRLWLITNGTDLSATQGDTLVTLSEDWSGTAGELLQCVRQLGQ
jgi:hypothetical protein